MKLRDCTLKEAYDLGMKNPAAVFDIFLPNLKHGMESGLSMETYVRETIAEPGCSLKHLVAARFPTTYANYLTYLRLLDTNRQTLVKEGTDARDAGVDADNTADGLMLLQHLEQLIQGAAKGSISLRDLARQVRTQLPKRQETHQKAAGEAFQERNKRYNDDRMTALREFWISALDDESEK